MMHDNYDLRTLKERLKSFGQEHLLAFWDELGDAEKRQLIEDIESIDFALVDQLYRSRDQTKQVLNLADKIEPPEVIQLGKGLPELPAAEAAAIGRQQLAEGKVAVILVAGGQGTRLGFDHPKGMFPIGPVSGASLFQIHAEKVLALSRRFGRTIPLLVMTSPATHEETTEFFAKHNRFGLQEDQLWLFRQGVMPAVDATTGKILLADKHRVALSPDGHGGMLKALVESGLLNRLRERGFERVFYFQVDNPLVQVCNPEFIGYHVALNSEFSSQVVIKLSPLDRLGNVVKVEDRLQVIEYSDLPKELAEKRTESGDLFIRYGSIAVHVMELSFLERMSALASALPFHIAHKKQAYVDAQGRKVVPTEPNAYKFERFIFDLMPQANNAIAVLVERDEHFAPLKNASGTADTDTPEWVREKMVKQFRRWLAEAGATICGDNPVEISPLYALDKDELRQKLSPGTTIDKPCYLR